MFNRIILSHAQALVSCQESRLSLSPTVPAVFEGGASWGPDPPPPENWLITQYVKVYVYSTCYVCREDKSLSTKIITTHILDPLRKKKFVDATPSAKWTCWKVSWLATALTSLFSAWKAKSEARRKPCGIRHNVTFQTTN